MENIEVYTNTDVVTGKTTVTVVLPRYFFVSLTKEEAKERLLKILTESL